MKPTTLEQYHARMQRVIDYLDRHLDDDDADAACSVAAFSKYHFHRQFSAIFGISAHRYVQLARLKRASYRLAFRAGDRITDIAFDAGYDAPEAFARVFRQHIGQAPSAFRITPDWQRWLATLEPLTAARSIYMTTFTRADVTIVDVPATPIAAMAHRGAPREIGATIQRFIAWRKAAGLPPRTAATFNVFPDDPLTTPAADYTMDLCVATDRTFDDPAIRSGSIPAGRCARLRLIGSGDNLEPAATWLYRDWLPASGEELRDFPFYCQRVTFFPDVAETEAVTDLFVPLV